jgi:TolB-like protein/AraC-like DNA-binding protein
VLRNTSFSGFYATYLYYFVYLPLVLVYWFFGQIVMGLPLMILSMEDLPSMSDQFLGKINQLIEENFDNEHYSVEDLAKQAGLSRSMLHRKLIKFTGKSASDLIMEKRLMRAREMLEKDVATASEIAYKVGFSSPSYFNKVFKNYFHVSPGDVRKGNAIIHQYPTLDQLKEAPVGAWEKIRRIGLIILAALLAMALTGAGIYYLLRKNTPIEKSIAILPFDNLSPDAENQYFADGIVEDLLNRISQIEGLKVISRTSSEMFRDKGSKTIPEIAELLGVSYILEGTVQRESDNIRINIQLIDAKRDDHVLSKRYDRNLSEVFKIQGEIAGQIASELSLVLTDRQTIALNQNQTTSLKAFEYKQLGRHHLNQRTQEGLFASVKYFRLAIKEDPDYALAYAELADTYFILPWYGYIDRRTGRDSAISLARKALELDKNLGEAHTILGAVFHEFDLDYDAAKEEFHKAIATKPNHSPAYQYYSEFLCTMGKLQEAREVMNKAIQLDPYSYVIRYASALLFYKQEDYQKALAENQICQELNNVHPWAVLTEFRIYMKLKDKNAALTSFKRLVKITDNWHPEKVDSVYSIGGMNSLLRWRLKEGSFSRKNLKAIYYAMLGDYETALDILESDLNEGLLEPFVLTEPEFKNIRSDPRLIAIRKKLGLPPL